MRTAQEMYNYSIENDFGKGTSSKQSLKHFKVIEDTLMKDEEVLMTFIGLHNFESLAKHENNYAYAVTNKRIIMAQKKLLAGENIKMVLLHLLNDISLETATGKGMVMNAVLTIDTVKEEFNVMVSAKQGRNILNEIQQILIDSKTS